jgi:hypothetical protein
MCPSLGGTKWALEASRSEVWQKIVQNYAKSCRSWGWASAKKLGRGQDFSGKCSRSGLEDGTSTAFHRCVRLEVCWLYENSSTESI